MNEEIMDDSRKDYENWKKRTLFFPDSKLEEALNRPDVYLPANEGFKFKVLLTSDSEFLRFIGKFDSLEHWEEAGIIEFELEKPELPPDIDGDEEWDYMGPPLIDVTAYLFGYNQFFPDGRRIQCTQTDFQTADRATIRLTKRYTYPILVSYCCDSSFDRLGDLTVRHIDITELGKMGDNIISW